MSRPWDGQRLTAFILGGVGGAESDAAQRNAAGVHLEKLFCDVAAAGEMGLVAAIVPKIMQPGEETEASLFRIEATEAFREPRTRTLKHDDTFAVLDSFGDMVDAPGSPDGLYHLDTRFLSRLELRLNGGLPRLLSSNAADNNAVLNFDLTNPCSIYADGTVLRRELVYVNRRQFVWKGAYCELVLVRNSDMDPHLGTISLPFAADFVDVF